MRMLPLGLALSCALLAACSDATITPAVERLAPLSDGGAEGTRPGQEGLPGQRCQSTLPPPGRSWEGKPLALLTTELSPAVMIYTSSTSLNLFAELAGWGLGAPTHAALATPAGLKTLTRADALELPVSTMSESWMLFWFRGAGGWVKFDAPWLVVLQHKPTTAKLDAAGLHLAGSAPIGYVAMMPLRGALKPDTAAWDPLPAAVGERARYFARVLREYPLEVKETFRLDPKTRSLVIRDEFSFLSTSDDWGTSALKLAPLPPVLALAARGGRMPMSLSGPLADPELATAFGPYQGIEGADCHEVSFPVLDYLTQTEKEQSPDTSSSVVATAAGRLQSAMKSAFSNADGFFHQDFGDPEKFTSPPPQLKDDGTPVSDGNSCYAFLSAQYYCRALPYVTSDVLANAKTRLRRYFDEWLLQPQRFKPYKASLLLTGPGIGDFGAYGDAGKFASNVLITLWAYGRYTGDWQLLKDRWSLIKKLFVTPYESSWRFVGRSTIAELGDEAAPALAYARIARAVDDEDQLAYGAYIFVRELVHHAVKHTGSPYFVEHQPINYKSTMPANVYLTDLWGDTAGWRIDGPGWGSTQHRNRWTRFGEPDVARFHRDQMAALLKKELEDPMTLDVYGDSDKPHINPSLVRLRSLLLDEGPAALHAVTPVETAQNEKSGLAAFLMSFLRVSRTPKLETLIPDDKIPTGWAEGLSRQVEDEPVLTAVVLSSGAAAPALVEWGWGTPSVPSGFPTSPSRWSYGHVSIGTALKSSGTKRLSWNSAAVIYDP